MKKYIIICILFLLIIYDIKGQNLEKAINTYNSGDYNKALNEFSNLYWSVKKEFKETDTVKFPTILFYLGKCYENLEDYNEAEYYYYKCIEIFQNIENGTDNLKYAFYCHNMAKFYTLTDYYIEAEENYFEAIELYDKKLSKNNIKTQLCKNDLAFLYIKTGNYFDAENILADLLKLYSNQKVKYSNEYLSISSNLSFMYNEIGQYEKAETIYLDNLSICKKINNKNSEKYIILLNDISSFYLKLGNFTKAKYYLDINFVLAEKYFSINEFLLSEVCNNLADYYLKTNDYKQAETYFLKSIKIIEDSEKYHDILYGKVSNNLAFFYTFINNFDKADYYFNEAIIEEINSAQDSLEYANQLNNLGLFYYEIDNFNKAEKCYLEAMPIYESLIGNKHLDYTNLITNLASLYFSYGDYKYAEEYIIEANKNYENHIINTGFFMSEKEREQFIKNKVGYNFDFFNSFYFNQKNKIPELIDLSYDNALLMKGLMLRSNSAMRNIVINSNDKKLISLYNNYLINSKTLIELQNKPVKNRKENIEALIDTINFQEKELYKSDFLKNSQKFADLKWQNIQKNLKENEVAIEFINFKLFDYQLTDSVFYCALLITKTCKNPKMIFLFEEKSLINITKTFNQRDINLYKELYSLIISPLNNSLKNITKIYFSPTGLLNNISFSALLSPDNEYFGDKFNLCQLSTTGILINKNNELFYDKIWETAIFGGADFGKNSKNLETPFQFLLGSKIEAENIINILKNKNLIFNIYSDKKFTETIFKSFSKNKSPEIIHLATHGFYNQNNSEIVKNLTVREEKQITLRNSENISVFSENPMLRSGLAFSGANISIEKNEVLYDKDDGILTSFEISNLYLANTKLVVLSACKTGLGDIHSTEGIYGLQRAFKMANVQFIIMSLWSVPDTETEQLMTDFYKYFTEGKEIHDAFKLAQNNLKIKYPLEPFYWAGFILIQ